MGFTITENPALEAPVAGRRIEAGTLELTNTIKLDRAIYAARFQTLVSDYRPAVVETPYEYAFTGASNNLQALACGLVFQLPGVLPGSANVRTTGSGTTIAARGGLHFAALIAQCAITLRIREINSGLTAFVGSATTVTLTRTNTTPAWVTGQCLFPTGISASGYYVVDVLYRGASVGTSGTAIVEGYVVNEPALTAL
jgi:hypothetical protein